MKKILKILPHTLIVLALIFIVIEILDWYNPYMNFLGLNVSTVLMIAFCLLNSAVILYNLVKGLDSYPPLALFWGYLAAEGLGKYQARRERKYLWVVVCGAVASLCFLLCYVLRTW